MDGYYGLDDYLDRYDDDWDRRMAELSEEEQNRLWDEQMYGRNGHNPPVVKTVRQKRLDENDGQPVQCPRCRSCNEPEDDGQYYCWLCEYQW